MSYSYCATGGTGHLLGWTVDWPRTVAGIEGWAGAGAGVRSEVPAWLGAAQTGAQGFL